LRTSSISSGDQDRQAPDAAGSLLVGSLTHWLVLGAGWVHDSKIVVVDGTEVSNVEEQHVGQQSSGAGLRVDSFRS